MLWHSIWHLFWHTFWHPFWHSFWHSIWHLFILAFSSGILSVPVQARPTASGAPDMRFGSRPSPNMRFGPRRSPELAIWGSATSWHTSGQERNRGEEEEGEGGVAPLLKSRDPHLAGGEESTEVFRNKLVYISTGGRPPLSLLCRKLGHPTVHGQQLRHPALEQTTSAGLSWHTRAGLRPTCFGKVVANDNDPRSNWAHHRELVRQYVLQIILDRQLFIKILLTVIMLFSQLHACCCKRTLMVNTNGSLLMVHYMVNSMWINACYPPALAHLAGRPALRAKAHHAEIIDMGQNDHTRKSMENGDENGCLPSLQLT